MDQEETLCTDMLKLFEALSGIIAISTEKCFIIVHVKEEIFLSLLRKLRISRDHEFTPCKDLDLT